MGRANAIRSVSAASPDPRSKHDVPGPPAPWWTTAAALGFVVGILASSLSGACGLWWLLAATGWWVVWRGRNGGDLHWRRACMVIVMIGLGASWSIARSPDPNGPSRSAYLHHDGVLAELEGGVVTRPELGQRIRVRGWRAPSGPPMNPGDFDYRACVAERGVVGRISMASRGNWDLLAPPGVTTKLWGAASWLERLREGVASRAAWSLGLGMGDDAQTLGLLQTLLLGETQNDIDTLRDQFRDVGLAHLLSISGAHLGILMGLVWLVARLVVPHPSRAATLVLAVLGLYLLAVPLRVPIVRA